MEEKLKVKKKLRVLLVVFFVILIPAYVHIFDTNGFESVRAYVIVILFATGMLTGVILTTARDYFRIKNEDTK